MLVNFDSDKKGKKNNMLNNLESKQKWHLIDLLLECPTMKNDKNRRLLVKELWFAETVEENESNKIHVLNIVNACLNYDNGLEHLLEVLHNFEGETIPFKTLLNEFINLAIKRARTQKMGKKINDS